MITPPLPDEALRAAIDELFDDLAVDMTNATFPERRAIASRAKSKAISLVTAHIRAGLEQLPSLQREPTEMKANARGVATLVNPHVISNNSLRRTIKDEVTKLLSEVEGGQS